jgi:hypothetical protein
MPNQRLRAALRVIACLGLVACGGGSGGTHDLAARDLSAADLRTTDLATADLATADLATADLATATDMAICAASACPTTGTACSVPTCGGNACVDVSAALGTACNDSGGVVCDGNGACTAAHCNDHVIDADETDVDCGGSCGPCGPAATCVGNTDCTTKRCQLGHCVKLADGATCDDVVECGSGHCVGGLCCDTACSGTCQACDAVHTGGSNGTCAAITTGLAAPAGQCTMGDACGNTGLCGVGGACQQGSTLTSCGTPSCLDGELVAGSFCTGTGSCDTMTAAPCPGHDTGSYCSNPGPSGTCVSRSAAGGACASNDQCTSGLCGPSGGGTHCCTSLCPSSLAACGATDCDGSGACVYPGTGVAPAVLQTPRDCQKIVCDGSGSDSAADDMSDLPVPSDACQTQPACTGTPLAPSFTPAAGGTDCTSTDFPTTGVCGPINSQFEATCVECNNDFDCLRIQPAGTLTCDLSTHACD